MSALAFTKLGAQVAASLGVTKVAGGIIQNNVPVLTTYDAVMVRIGTFVIGSMLVQATTEHVERTIDEVQAWRASRKSAETE